MTAGIQYPFGCSFSHTHIIACFPTFPRFPIHCAVIGGNLDLVKWLVDAHGCPLSMKRNLVSGTLQSLQTSKSRTLMDLAMTGRPKTDILQYLVSKNLSVSDTNDASLASKTLEALIRPGKKSFGRLHFSSSSCCDASAATVDDAVSEIEYYN